MNMKRQISLVILCSLLFSFGCNNEDISKENNSDNRLLKINPQVLKDANSTSSNSRSNANITPYEGTSINLSLCYDNDKTSIDNFFSIKWENINGSWTSDKSIYWKDNSTSAFVYSYAPYIEGLDEETINLNSIPFSVQANQSNEKDFISSDLVGYSQKVNPSSLSDGVLAMNMSHMLSQLVARINFKSSYIGEKNISSVKIMTKQNVQFDITTMQTKSDDNDTNIELTPCTSIENLEYKAILPPQNIASGSKFMTFIIDGKNYTYIIPSNITHKFESNKSTVLNLTVGNKDVTLGGVTVEGWEQQTLSIASSGNWTDFASAEEPAKEDNFYIINNASELAWIVKNKNVAETTSGEQLMVRLNNDIDLKGHYWIPLNVGNAEMSVFDGNGKTISNNN